MSSPARPLVSRRRARRWPIALALGLPTVIALTVALGLYVLTGGGVSLFRPPVTLGEAIQTEASLTIYQLLKAGHDPNKLEPYRHPRLNGGESFQATPFYIAAASGNISMVEIMLKAGADPTLARNQPAICPVIRLGHGNILQLFLRMEMNVNPEPKCDQGRHSPLRLAREVGDAEAEKRLLLAGAKEDY